MVENNLKYIFTHLEYFVSNFTETVGRMKIIIDLEYVKWNLELENNLLKLVRIQPMYDLF